MNLCPQNLILSRNEDWTLACLFKMSSSIFHFHEVPRATTDSSKEEFNFYLMLLLRLRKKIGVIILYVPDARRTLQKLLVCAT